jgi:hypothetical protein
LFTCCQHDVINLYVCGRGRRTLNTQVYAGQIAHCTTTHALTSFTWTKRIHLKTSNGCISNVYNAVVLQRHSDTISTCSYHSQHCTNTGLLQLPTTAVRWKSGGGGLTFWNGGHGSWPYCIPHVSETTMLRNFDLMGGGGGGCTPGRTDKEQEAHPGGGCAPPNPQKPNFKIHRFCKYYDIKIFT